MLNTACPHELVYHGVYGNIIIVTSHMTLDKSFKVTNGPRSALGARDFSPIDLLSKRNRVDSFFNNGFWGFAQLDILPQGLILVLRHCRLLGWVVTVRFVLRMTHVGTV